VGALGPVVVVVVVVGVVVDVVADVGGVGVDVDVDADVNVNVDVGLGIRIFSADAVPCRELDGNADAGPDADSYDELDPKAGLEADADGGTEADARSSPNANRYVGDPDFADLLGVWGKSSSFGEGGSGVLRPSSAILALGWNGEAVGGEAMGKEAEAKSGKAVELLTRANSCLLLSPPAPPSLRTLSKPSVLPAASSVVPLPSC